VRVFDSAVSAQLSQSGRNDGGAWADDRSFDHRSVGAQIRSSPEPADPVRDAAPERSWRVDETYIRVAGQWAYLYRAIDSAGNTIDFLVSPYRDTFAAKSFLQLAVAQAGRIQPRVINVDGHPAYPVAVEQLKESGELGRNCRCRRSPYMNNMVEQDHPYVKKRVIASQWFRSVDGALNTIAGYEAMNIIRKGQIRWLPKTDTVGQVRFVECILGIAK
jgi:IS6 family transposase